MRFTNWYLEHNETPPIGLSVNLLEGAFCMLSSAVNNLERNQLRELVPYSAEIVALYLRSQKVAEASNTSCQTRRDLITGKAILQELHTTLHIAASYLSSND